MALNPVALWNLPYLREPPLPRSRLPRRGCLCPGTSSADVQSAAPVAQGVTVLWGPRGSVEGWLGSVSALPLSSVPLPLQGLVPRAAPGNFLLAGLCPGQSSPRRGAAAGSSMSSAVPREDPAARAVFGLSPRGGGPSSEGVRRDRLGVLKGRREGPWGPRAEMEKERGRRTEWGQGWTWRGPRAAVRSSGFILRVMGSHR